MQNDSVYKRKVVGDSLESSYLGRTMDLHIYLPPGHTEFSNYPILYTQDGQHFFMYGRIATIAQQLILEEGLNPFIIVGVDVNVQERNSEYSPLGKKNSAYRKFFLDELIPYIEQKYQPPTKGLQRILAGDSLGGTVSLDIALDRPELFQGIISLSGAFWDPTQKRIRETNPFPNFDMYMIIGEQETAIETHFGTMDFLQLNRQTRDLLLENQASLMYVEKPGQHIWGFWQKELPDILRHYFRPSAWIS